jgi:hypothetical protein
LSPFQQSRDETGASGNRGVPLNQFPEQMESRCIHERESIQIEAQSIRQRHETFAHLPYLADPRIHQLAFELENVAGIDSGNRGDPEHFLTLVKLRANRKAIGVPDAEQQPELAT